MITPDPTMGLGPSEIQDIHVAVAGLNPRLEVVFLEVNSTNGNIWRFGEKPDSWRAVFKREKGSTTGDVFFEPAWVETGRPFHLIVRYEDGSTVETDFRGGKADHKLRVTSVALSARWLGQDRQDRTGTGPSVGADGYQDVRIQLSHLATKLNLLALRINGPGGAELGIGAESQAAADCRSGSRSQRPFASRPLLSADGRHVGTAAQADRTVPGRPGRYDHRHSRPV